MFETGKVPGTSIDGGPLFDSPGSATSSSRPQPADRTRPTGPEYRPLQPTLPPRLNRDSAFSSKGYSLGSTPMFRSPSWCRRMDIPPDEQQITTPPSAEASALAFAALQLLPVPVMVLSSERVIVFANEAMGPLLDVISEEKPLPPSDGWRPQSVTDIIGGKSLSDVGIEIHDERCPEWEEWKWKMLFDGVDEQMKKEALERSYAQKRDFHDNMSFENYGIGEPKPLPWRISLDPRGATVNVVFQPKKTFQSVGHEIPREARIQVSAQMSVVAWTINSETHFTLTFTSVTQSIMKVKDVFSLEPPRAASPMLPLELQVPRAVSPMDAVSTSPGGTQATSSDHDCDNEAVCSDPIHGSSLWLAPAEVVPLRSLLQQSIAKLKDALIDLMELPVFIIWDDGTLAFPNRAALELIRSTSKICPPAGHRLDLINCFKIYKADFSRPLTLEEHPISRICKSKENIHSVKLGLIDVMGNKKIYDVGGKGIIDEETGEFVAGMCWARDVTEFQDKLDAQKAADELRFMTICNVMPQLIWTTTPTGYVDWWSERWYDFTGLSSNDSLGLAWEKCIHPQDLGETLKRWRDSLKTGQGYGMEYRVKQRNGQYRWMLARGLPLRDPATDQILKWFGTCTDIDELVQARLDARRTREQLTNVMAHAALTLWTIDRDFKVSMIEGDQIWAKNAGTPQSSFVGKSIYDIVSKKEHPGFYAPLEGILNGTITEEKNVEYDMNGRCLRTTYVPIKGQENALGEINEDLITGVIGVCVDITDRVNTLHELAEREKENQILMANERAANEASKLKSVFLASMSHEIRTPIAGVLGMADLMLDTSLSGEQFEFVTSIQSSANALLTVINDILDFSKVESGKMEIENVQFNLFHVVGDVIRMLAFEAEKKKLVFEHDIKLMCDGKMSIDMHQGQACCTVGSGNQCCVIGDPGRLRQVLTNLIANSIKFTQKGSVRVTLTVEDDDNNDTLRVKFVVQDTGIGIEEKKQTLLFHPFTQADSSTARRFGGTGLGLSISKNLVELMGGSIGLSSKVGEGTEAWFIIPFIKPERSSSSRSASVSSETSQESLDAYLYTRPVLMRNSGTAFTFPLSQHDCKLHLPPDLQLHTLAHVLKTPMPPTPPSVPTIHPNKRKDINVLVVEDNEVNKQIALKVIEKLGFSVSAVSNGVEAIQYLHSCTEESKDEVKKPDIILMDVHMPEMDGYQATQIIRSGNLASAGLGFKDNKDAEVREWLKGLPIVALTASAIRGDSDKCLDAGMDDYLSKPVKRADLERMLLKWLSDQSRQGSVVEPSSFGDLASLMAGSSPQGAVEDRVLDRRVYSDSRDDKGRGGGNKPLRQRPAKVKRTISNPANGNLNLDFYYYHPQGNALLEETSEDDKVETKKEGRRKIHGDDKPTLKVGPASKAALPLPQKAAPTSRGAQTMKGASAIKAGTIQKSAPPPPSNKNSPPPYLPHSSASSLLNGKRKSESCNKPLTTSRCCPPSSPN